MGDNKEPRNEAGRAAAETATTSLTSNQLEDGCMAPSKSTKAPAFQFFPRDFLASPKVDRMAMTERGAYITLLSRCWMDNGLPMDMGELAYFCRMKPSQFERLWTNGQLGKCFHERAGKFHNERLDAERKKQTANRQRQSDNAKAGWQKRGNATSMPPHESGITRADAPAADADSKQQIANENSGGGLGEFPMDIWTRELINLYPKEGRCGWNLVERPLFAALQSICSELALTPIGAWDWLKARLEQHKTSHQWRDKRMVKRIDRWLIDGLYLAEPAQDAPDDNATDSRTPAWARGL